MKSHLDEHVPMQLRQGMSGKPTAQMKTVTVLRDHVLNLCMIQLYCFTYNFDMYVFLAQWGPWIAMLSHSSRISGFIQSTGSQYWVSLILRFSVSLILRYSPPTDHAIMAQGLNFNQWVFPLHTQFPKKALNPPQS